MEKTIKVDHYKTNLISDFMYSIISLNMHDHKKWSLPVIDVGCGNRGLVHRQLFPASKDYICIDIDSDMEIEPSRFKSRVVMAPMGFPDVPVSVLDSIKDSAVICMFSMTIGKQYMHDDVFNKLKNAHDLYITFWENDFDAYLKYCDAFKNHECVYTRPFDGLKIMHYWN